MMDELHGIITTYEIRTEKEKSEGIRFQSIKEDKRTQFFLLF
jgi:hypothetical protein